MLWRITALIAVALEVVPPAYAGVVEETISGVPAPQFDALLSVDTGKQSLLRKEEVSSQIGAESQEIDECADKRLPDAPFSCGERYNNDTSFCEESLAQTHCARTCGICLLTRWEQNCQAPEHVGHAMAPSCAEGDTILSQQYCTPVCQVGMASWLDLQPTGPSWACAGNGGVKLGKLCCFMGALTPATYRCIPDLFQAIDADGNGMITRTEYEHFSGRPRPQSKAEKEAAKLKKKHPNGVENKPRPKDSSFVMGYLCFVSTLLVSIAIVLVFIVCKVRKGGANEPPTSESGAGATSGHVSDISK